MEGGIFKQNSAWSSKGTTARIDKLSSTPWKSKARNNMKEGKRKKKRITNIEQEIMKDEGNRKFRKSVKLQLYYILLTVDF